MKSLKMESLKGQEEITRSAEDELFGGVSTYGLCGCRRTPCSPAAKHTSNEAQQGAGGQDKALNTPSSVGRLPLVFRRS